jgi:ribosome-binding factor A
MPSRRTQRVANLLRSEIATIIQRRLKDPRVTMVTITSVEVAPDLRQARVLFSVYGNRKKLDNALDGLKSAAGYIRSELMSVLHLRPMPHLEFAEDESLARGARTLDLLEKIRHEREDSDGRAGSGDSTDPQQ